MTQEKSARELVEAAVKRAKEEGDLYKEIGEQFQKEFGDHSGPLFGPRDDIERRKRINEIRGGEKNDK